MASKNCPTTITIATASFVFLNLSLVELIPKTVLISEPLEFGQSEYRCWFETSNILQNIQIWLFVIAICNLVNLLFI